MAFWGPGAYLDSGWNRLDFMIVVFGLVDFIPGALRLGKALAERLREGWVEVMYKVQQAYSFWVWIFFFAVVIVGSLVAVNLFLVVITTQFSETKKNERERQAKMAKMNAEKDPEHEQGDPEETEEERRRAKWKGIFRWLCPCINPAGQSSFESSKVAPEPKAHGPASFKPVVPTSHTIVAGWGVNPVQKKSAWGSAPSMSEKSAWGSAVADSKRAQTPTAASVGLSKNHPSRCITPPRKADSAGYYPSEDPFPLPTMGDSATSPVLPFTALHEDKDLLESAESRAMTPTESTEVEAGNSETKSEEEKHEGDDEPQKNEDEVESEGCFDRARSKVRVWVTSDLFNNTIMVLIIFNTLFMASEYYGQPDLLTEIQMYANLFFTGAFILEMLLKLFGLGVKDYVSDSMNLFDGFIVLSSIVELAMGGGGFISVLRTFRLMRIFKLMRFIPSLQRQMAVMASSVVDVSNFCLILLLFMFIEAVLGMFLFGAKMSGRSNFDNFYNAMVTVFQILTIEDWPGVMFDAVSATNYAAAAYFVILLVIGTYILSNLFVAILLEGFAERAEEEERKIRKQLAESRNAAFVAKLKGAFAQGSLSMSFDVDSFQVSGNSYDDESKKAKRKLAEKRQAERDAKELERYEMCIRLYRADFGACKQAVVRAVESSMVL